MTENEYFFIKKIEEDYLPLFYKLSNLENIKNPNELMMLHGDIIHGIESIQSIFFKQTITSPDAKTLLDQMKFGLIEALATIDQIVS